MKKQVLIPLFCVLIGCGAPTKESVPSSFKDGTYTETASGKNGKFDVTVTIEDGKITDIVVGKNKETPSRGGTAIAKLPQKMIDEQTYAVDGISGATITSNGLKNAVKSILQKAGE